MSLLQNPSEFYYRDLRTDIIPLLPQSADSVLDLGCGAGVTGAYLKQKNIAKHVVGVEVQPQPAEAARHVLDDVRILDLNRGQDLPFNPESFDLILCLDVLEHLVDPWSALEALKKTLRPNGMIIASIPNVRHFRTSLRLVFAGRWDYVDGGTLDSTHLRFFTKHSCRELFVRTGFEVTYLAPSKRMEGPKAKFLRAISFGLLGELLDYQYLICARKQAT